MTEHVAERRRVVVTAPRVVEVVTDPLPAPAPTEALVRLVVAGICGSDKAGFTGEHFVFSPPYHPGHETVGEVVAVGDEVEGVAPGERVTVVPALSCGRCRMCGTGRTNLCEQLDFFGCGYREGGMAEYFTVPATALLPVPSSFSDHRAVLIEPLAASSHAVRLAGDLTGQSVVILGAGTIGLLALVAAKAAGAGFVAVSDVLATKRETALTLGADAVFDAQLGDFARAVRGRLGGSADVVVDCVAKQGSLDSAVQLAVKGGTVVLLGGARRPVTVDLPVVQEFQIRIQGSTTYVREDFSRAVELLRSGAVDENLLVSARFPLSEAAAAFDAAMTPNPIKVLVGPDD
jgi:2-desacetyl-2-hydroxyethyl bacteriochlorophyllide A dehydrogenase